MKFEFIQENNLEESNGSAGHQHWNVHVIYNTPKTIIGEQKGRKKQNFLKLPEGDNANGKVKRTFLMDTLGGHERVYTEFKVQRAD